MTEADFQAQVLELAHLYGWRVLHVRRSIGRRGGAAAWQTTTSIKGWPDLFAWHPDRGTCFAAELKSDTGRLTPDQRQVLDQLERCGIDAHVWRPADFDTARHVLAGTTGGRGLPDPERSDPHGEPASPQKPYSAAETNAVSGGERP